ncbi:MAG: 4Fe-4S binding protein [Rickettsiales bacterium]|jgi:iron-only hydrogenase group A|nr:4Fe-4S binding protein [Rickettsiales bacterium]
MNLLKNSVEFDDNKCVKCTRCITRCKANSVGCLEISLDENGKKHLTKNEKSCLGCGQCTIMCPINAIREQSNLDELRQILQDKTKVKIVQCAPAIRTIIPEKKANTLLRLLGFDKVFDVNFGADITTMVEAEELVERIKNNGTLPMFTSCCPSWVEYCLVYHPEFKEHLTTARSPNLHAGLAYKTWWAERENIDTNNIIVVSVMPCTAKKDEIKRETAKLNGKQIIDIGITVRELLQLSKEKNIVIDDLDETDADTLGEYTGAAVIYGASGGVMESALRTGYYMMTNENLADIELKQVRPEDGFKTAEIDIKGQKIKIAVVQTIQNFEKLLPNLKDYHYVEIMNCIGGCLGGGGMPVLPIKPSDQVAEYSRRREILFDLDKNKTKRKAHENEYVNEYFKWIDSKNDKHFEHICKHNDWKLNLT